MPQNPRSPDDHTGDPRARLSAELRLFTDALTERVQPWLDRYTQRAGATAAPAGSSPGREEHPPDGEAHPAGSCGWCPLCAGIALLRGERTELAERAVSHAAGLLTALRAVVADVPPPPDPGAHGTGPAGDTPGGADRAEPAVHRIEVQRESRRPANAAPAGEDGRC